MPIDFTCVRSSSVLWNALGGALVLLLSTRGTDADGVPSVFFFEITLARILLCATWALVHLLYSFFNESRAADMVVPNAILGAVRVIVLSSQFVWHRHWSTGDGWKLLRSRFVRPTLWRWLLFSTALTGIGATLSSSIVWHHPGDAQYIDNIVYQCLSYTGCFLSVYLMRLHFDRGSIWLVLSVGCLWNGSLSGLTLLASVLAHSVSIPDPYGFLGQSVFWSTFAIIGYRFHTEVRHSLESPLNLGVPTARLAAVPLKAVSVFGASTNIVSVVPLSSDERETKPTAVSATPLSAWAESAPSMPLHAPPSPSPIQPASSQGTDFGEDRVVSLASTPSRAGLIDARSEASIESDIPTDLDNESNIAPPEVVQVHKLVVSLVELFVFTGTAYASESFVRLGFPSLPICGQFDPTKASWLEFLQSIFDLLST